MAPPPQDEKFRKGVAISVWQNSADDGVSNWTRYAYSRWPFSKFGISTTRGKHKVGKSCDFWNRFKEDLQLAKDAGCTAFRFSFEWARIEPTRGTYDQGAIRRFHEMLDAMEELGLEPNATLHHFTHPTWFEDLGGFMDEANIPLFVEWSCFMFREFGPRIKLWSTFNEPTCYCFLAFIVGMMPPSYIFNLTAAGRTLGNMLKAHTACYRALKALPGGQGAEIGLVHHHITFAAQGTGLAHTVAATVAKWMEYWWGWDVVDHWMMTGEFEWKLPVLGTWYRWSDPAGKPPCDWWGINYYSRPAVHWNFGMGASEANEPVSDTHFRLYPQGLYDSIKDASVLGVPMYITETGLADAKDRHRAWFIRTHYGMLLKALRDGYDVRGCFFWTLMDNIEWHEGFHIKFGLYKWEPQYADQYASTNNRPPQGLTLREGGKALHEIYSSWPDALGELRAHAAKEWGGAATSTGGAEEGAGLVAGGAAVKPSPSAPVSVPAVAAGHKGGEGSKAVHLSATAGSAAPPAPAAAAPAAAVDAEEVEIERVGLVGQQA
mmetsp:Transcript_540/g.1443  ORF Transcript_540/g.1443 Transcript_540/m.1443 type:complete len:547 (-) Transcript_540:1396-3036(-)